MIKTYQDLQNWLNKIGKERIPKIGEWNLDNVNKILDILKHPELEAQYRIITGGTAGKGSTTRIIHEVLTNQGFSVATFSSPDISCTSERFRSGNKLISEKDLIKYANELIKVCKNNELKLSFYEFMFGIFMIMCKHKKPDIINLEVGCGGEFDATNAIQGDRISVLTFVGKDHLGFIGNTIKEIAQTKAKIFNKNTIAGFSYEEKFKDIIQKEGPVKVQFIKNNGEKSNSKLALNVCKFILKNESNNKEFKIFNLKFKNNLKVTECHPALDARSRKKQGIDSWSSQEGQCKNGKIENCLKIKNFKLKIKGSDTLLLHKKQKINIPNLPARWEIFKKNGKIIILDGAHSEPRIKEIIKKFQKIKGKKYLLLGIKEGRTGEFLKPLIKLADKTYLTEFNRNGNKSITVETLHCNVSTKTPVSFLSPHQVRDKLQRESSKSKPIFTKDSQLNWEGHKIKNPITAFNQILNKMQKNETLLITGSFHLCGTIRDLFYPPEEILKQQTEFPK